MRTSACAATARAASRSWASRGRREEVAARRKRALELARRGGGLAVGRSPGEAWRKGRFSAPYLRDELLTQGVMVETLETATRWSNVRALHRKVGTAIADALSAEGTPGLVMCHVSHLYETGASLYFTFIARQREGAELEQWATVKRAASQAIVDGGGTITHHHAVGRDHAPWLRGRGRARGRGRPARAEGRARPGRDHEPGKAAALTVPLREAGSRSNEHACLLDALVYVGALRRTGRGRRRLGLVDDQATDDQGEGPSAASPTA